MTDFYSRLTYKTDKKNSGTSWIGNLRFFALEDGENNFSFQCISALKSMTHQERVAIAMNKKLFDVKVNAPLPTYWVYGADYIENDNFKVYFPFYEYGCLFQSDVELRLTFEGEALQKDNTVTVKSGEYYISLAMENDFELKESCLVIKGGKCSAAFHLDGEKALADAGRLLEGWDNVLAENREFWNGYLASCPTVEMSEDFHYKHPTLGFEEHYTSEEFVTRQLWHYWCLLIDVSEIEFNSMPLYMSPDMPSWLGTWSNDGPQCMAALSVTNQHGLARRLITEYLKFAMTDDGQLTWYLHSDGVPSLGTMNDVGRFSHGAPYPAKTVEYYIRATGDKSILDADCGGKTVYEKLRTYMANIHKFRDINGDGLIEWCNLWETGWDDKGGTFFHDADIDEWMNVVSGDDEEAIKKFYAEKQRPVIPVVEQVLTLWGLESMVKLAKIKGDFEMEKYCRFMYEKMIEAVSDACWNEKDGFYYDIDVKSGAQTTEKCADAFYWMNFEKDKARQRSLLEHINNPEEFNCHYIPMLSRDSKGFNQFGYWSGGHWAREMSFISMGLNRSGFADKAWEILVRAIMVTKGNIIAEVINPLTGIRSTHVTKMACTVLNIISLLDYSGKMKWFEEN